MDVNSADDAMSLPSTEQTSVVLPIDDFAHDLEYKLGRANGNIFHRIPGVEGLHDGQIMVRLKKKRFIIIDYSIVPNSADIAAAAAMPHNIMIPSGAGKQKCVSQDCTKVGVPVMLFDSDPEQPTSLYLRSGLCFTCQRLLNEKRRTQRKRKSDADDSGITQYTRVHQHPIDTNGAVNAELQHLPSITDSYNVSCEKRFTLNGEILELNPDAIIINGPLDDTKHHGPGYEYTEIGADLQKITQEVSNDTMQLANTISSLNEIPHSNSAENGQILAMYEKTFVSISKGIFLLNQWKISWDAAVAHHHDHEHHDMSDDGVNADVVASAAAVAAAQSVVSEGGNHHDDDEKPEVFSV